ncbi:MAG: flippase [Candidatus Aenigmatarchaeota archaeon]
MTSEEKKLEGYARRLLKGSTVVFLCMVASAFVAFLVRMFLARSLGVEGYGLFYSVFSFVSFFVLFRDLGLNSALVKFIPEFRVKGDLSSLRSSLFLVFLFQSLSSFLLFVLLFLLSGWLSFSFFRTPEALFPFRLLLLWFLVSTFYQLLRFTFQGLQDMLAYSLLDFLWILVILLGSWCLVPSWGVNGVAFSYLLSAGLLTVGGAWYLGRKYREVVSPLERKRGTLRKLLSFALPSFVGGLGSLVLAYTDTLMLTFSRGTSEVGLYQAAQPLAGLLGYFVGALTAALFPLVSEMWTKGERKLVRETTGFLFKSSLAVVLPFSLLFLSFPEVALRLVFGEEYLGSCTALRILSCHAVLWTLLSVMGTVVAGVGEPLLITKTVAWMAALNFFGNFFLIPPFGASGAALTTFLSSFLGVLLLPRYAKKKVGKAPLLPFLKVVAGGILVFFSVSFLKSFFSFSPWLEVLVIFPPILLLYFFWLLEMGVFTEGEKKILFRLLSFRGERS